MFDTNMIKQSSNHYNILNNHSASGLLCKSMGKSKIVRFDRNSEFEGTIFDDEPYIEKIIKKSYYDGSTYNSKEKVKIVVLQVLLVSDKSYIVEYITEDDFYEELGYMRSE